MTTLIQRQEALSLGITAAGLPFRRQMPLRGIPAVTRPPMPTCLSNLQSIWRLSATATKRGKTLRKSGV